MHRINHPHHQTAGTLGLTRRDFVSLAGLGVAGYALRTGFQPGEVLAQSTPLLFNTADACIFIKLPGAPSHMDTFGVKVGSWTPADWDVQSIGNITLPNRLFPNLLRQADKFSI